MKCTGTAEDDHCCYVAGERCRYLVENVDGRRFACSLRLHLGSWEAVHADPRYRKHVQVVWDALGLGYTCGSWVPQPGEACCMAEPLETLVAVT
jgi:hypothetical protein